MPTIAKAPACTPILQEIRRGMFGAEIGVARGESSLAFLSRGTFMFLIDPWCNYDGYAETLGAGESFQITSARVARYQANRVICMMTSEQAAQMLVIPPLDFVFIDGNHAYEYVKQDVALWWPKIKPGGVMYGHDYNLDCEFSPGAVKRAVDEFAATVGCSVKAWGRQDELQCWSIAKPEQKT